MAGFTESTRYQVRKHPKSAPGGQVLGPTRYQNRGKVRLVNILKKHTFPQTPHSEPLTKFPLGQPQAPGTKTPQKCAWWAGFRPHQVRKHPKNAPGGHVLDPTRYENTPKPRLVRMFQT